MDLSVRIMLEDPCFDLAQKRAFREAKIRFLDTVDYTGFSLNLVKHYAQYYYPTESEMHFYEYEITLYKGALV